MHDFNPLFVYPIVRPWPKRNTTTLDEDRMIAPLPNLILSRLSDGIYNQLFDVHRDKFSRYFGPVFEAYVGEVLQKAISSGKLLTEADIKRVHRRGKIPDYVVIDGSKAILIECKATGFRRKAFATADAVSIDQSISRIVEGLIQLHEFKNACDNHALGLNDLVKCQEYRFVIVTFEPFYIINSVPFKEIVEKLVSQKLGLEKIVLSSWYVFGVDDWKGCNRTGLRALTFPLSSMNYLPIELSMMS